jgi:hypothetical protein
MGPEVERFIDNKASELKALSTVGTLPLAGNRLAACVNRKSQRSKLYSQYTLEDRRMFATE